MAAIAETAAHGAALRPGLLGALQSFSRERWMRSVSGFALWTRLGNLLGCRAASGVCVQPAAVLFADIVGFTRLSEQVPPERVFEVLRGFHACMAREVYRHGGNVHQYSGDEIMATFGAPHAGRGDAARALACAFAMLDAMTGWNLRRRRLGDPGLAIGIGLHFGAVVMGSIGLKPHVERAIVGDTVNVAKKLETMTRTMGTPLVVSDDLIGAVKREDANSGAVARLTEHGPSQVPGRLQRISTWVLGPAPAATFPVRRGLLSPAALAGHAPEPSD